MDNETLQLLHTNQRLLVKELLRRGAVVRAVDLNQELLEVELHDRKELLLDRFSSVPPFHLVNITADKKLVKTFLQEATIATAPGEIFTVELVDTAIEYADSLGYPIVFKPNWGSYGDFVRPGIQNADALSSNIYEFAYHRGGDEKFLIERHIPGKEYRIFITSQGKYAVLHREPAHVVGDGVHTIEALAELETQRRISLKTQQGTSLCPIALDQHAIYFLKQGGKKITDVPAKNEKVYLRHTSNLALGGVSIDVTDNIHPSVIDIATRTLKVFDGLPCLGIDFITENIDAPQHTVGHAIIEVNSSPGLVMHMQPAIGTPRDVASYLADVMFPTSR